METRSAKSGVGSVAESSTSVVSTNEKQSRGDASNTNDPKNKPSGSDERNTENTPPPTVQEQTSIPATKKPSEASAATTGDIAGELRGSFRKAMAEMTEMYRQNSAEMHASIRESMCTIKDSIRESLNDLNAGSQKSDPPNRQVQETTSTTAQSNAHVPPSTSHGEHPVPIGQLVTDTLAPILKDAMRDVAELVKQTRDKTPEHEKATPENPMQTQGTAPGGAHEQPDHQVCRKKLVPNRSCYSRVAGSETTSTGCESEEEPIPISRPPRYNHRSTSGPKLPNFNGVESWKVWYNRFQDIARIQNWSESRKLVEILPRLQGVAGEFTYGQLSEKTRNNFSALVKELEFRFRKIETARTFAVKFSNRNQKRDESVEDYAATLKALYDKAYPRRDGLTRQEDLLRRFLDGLTDERVQAQVEYVKEPTNIDQAVYEVVNYMETRKHGRRDRDWQKTPTRMVRPYPEDEDEDDGEEDSEGDTGRVVKARGKPTKGNNNRPAATENSDVTAKQSEDVTPSCLPGETGNTHIPQVVVEALQGINKSSSEVSKVLENICNKLNTDRRQNNRQSGGRNQNTDNSRTQNQGGGRSNDSSTQNRSQGKTYTCFKCGQEGHYIRECPLIVTGQFQVETPQGRNVSTPSTSQQTN